MFAVGGTFLSIMNYNYMPSLASRAVTNFCPFANLHEDFDQKLKTR